MKDLFVKGLRFLKHREILPPVVRCAYRMAANRKVLELPAEEAWKTVRRIVPRPQGTCCWERPDNGAPAYDISVIIPFYNTEAYAVQCIKSVLSQQTDFRMETILVDDGSPDGCGRILDSYAERENLVVIHQKNQGLSAARNTGICAARGEYLLFLDSDDYLAEGAIQALMTAARAHDADMVEGAHLSVTASGEVLKRCGQKPGVYEDDVYMFGYAWGKVIRRELFRMICFPVGYWYEDCIIANLIFPAAGKTVTISDVVYHYRQNPGGIMASTYGNPKSLHLLYITENVLDTLQKLGFRRSERQQLLLVMELSRVLLARTQHFGEETLPAIFIAACDIAQRYDILPEAPTGNYFYDEIVEALRHRQYSRWKWASMLI